MAKARKRRKIERVARTTPGISADRLEALKSLLPEAFTENTLDCEKLQEVLGTHIQEGAERYSFTWAGKRDAILTLQQPSDATLVPDRTHSIQFDKTRNVFIEGDNLEVLKLLYKPYFGRVKFIYIDPPYNTGKDRIYVDDYAHPIEAYLKITQQVGDDGTPLRSNPETGGRYHSAWLSMMYPRLYLARQLLRDDGLIFVSIDDNEVHHLRMLLNEIFGEENFVAQIVWKSKFGAGAKPTGFIEVHEYILCYAKSGDLIKSVAMPLSEKLVKIYNRKDEYFETRGPYATWPLETTSLDARPNLRYPILHAGTKIWPRKQWLWSKERVAAAQKVDGLVFRVPLRKVCSGLSG